MVPGSEHLSKQYDADLEGIRSKVMQMGGLVEAQARAAIEGFSNGQVDTIEEVIARDQRVNAYEVELDEDCAHIIARRQPAARDLRMILAISKTTTSEV